MQQAATRLVPVTVISGFLGAGKTTLLRRILSTPDGQRFGVLVNDFGEINIDSALIVETSADQISLSNGCVCCTIQDDLIDAILTLLRERPDIDRILIEASGVARSVPIVETIEASGLASLVVLDGVFCVVDAATFHELDYSAMELAIDQITGADMLILNKTDLVTDAQRGATESRLRGVMPAIRIVPAIEANIPRTLLFGVARGNAGECDFHEGEQSCSCHRHDGGHDHVHRDNHADLFTSWSWRTLHPLDETRFRAAIRKLPSNVMRAKGVLHLQGDGETRCVEFQLVGKRWALVPASAELARTNPHGMLVVIGFRDAFEPEALEKALENCLRAEA